MGMLTITASGNCNFAYISGLRSFGDAPEKAMAELLTNPVNPYGYYTPAQLKAMAPAYRPMSVGMWLFAQGSEDPIDLRPYSKQFMDYIHAHKLGTVHQHDPVPNRLHGNKPGILYVWTVDHAACQAWWNEHVKKPWEAAQEAAKKAEVDELAAKTKKEMEKQLKKLK